MEGEIEGDGGGGGRGGEWREKEKGRGWVGDILLDKDKDLRIRLV